ncbi:coiled-coil domain-containing protein 125-like isoform X2 [Mizuhopecten yessoensis]|uniref:coiled-coil domain-containing protein 125-like isoform X2 n=1 Tax=Mizuhopecten yessoensis TaxID=6573 RepID=UPI000B459EF7|nr:coiled-coil domain-containing protein 125-like isoform X2 [Mizuhopecten yessoensis]
MSLDAPNQEENNSENGDLGLGEGLRPGSLPKILKGWKVKKTKQKEKYLPDDFYCGDLHPPIQSKSRLTFPRKTRTQSHSSIDSDDMSENDKGNDNFPTFADIPYGTSLKQQKRLFEKDLSNIRQRCQSLDSSSQLFLSDGNSKTKLQRSLSRDAIEKKLLEAEQEVEELKNDLEIYHKRLEAKYQAIAILKTQVSEIEEKDRKTKKYSHSLEKEVNQLHFELGKQESSTEDSQQLWAVRFDSVCRDNVALTVELEQKTAELKAAHSQNLYLHRERDELIALLDVQERGIYTKSKSTSSDDQEYSQYTSAEVKVEGRSKVQVSSELAMMGACKCRGTEPEPCGCAMAAAHLQREIIKCHEKNEMYLRRRDEAYMTADAYHMAFEEQLSKNKALMLHLIDIATSGSGPSRITKAKAIVKRFIQMLNDEDYTTELKRFHPQGEGTANNGTCPLPPGVPPITDRDLVLAFTEILHDRTEDLANKKIAIQVLGDRIQHLEERLNIQEDVF